MFKKSISSTAMTSDAANMFFQNINGEMFGNDNTFLATLRALVAPRIPEGEGVYLSFGRSDYSDTAISETAANEMVRAICADFPNEIGQIYIHNLCHREETSNIASIELLKRQFCEVYKGWSLHEKISVFYQKSFRVICFINNDLKSVALFVESLNLQKLHYLQMSILAFMPWYFDASKGMSPDEMELVYSLRERSSEKYEACIMKMSQMYDFESSRIRHLLNGFELRYEQEEQRRVERDISSVDTNLRELDRQFASYIQRRNDLCIRLTGLKARIANGGDSELMEYFLCNRKLVLREVSGTSMLFAVRDYLSYFDEDAAANYIKNKSGYFYRACNNRSEKDSMEKLLNAIFVDQTIKIRFCAAYRFDMNGSVEARHRHDFGQEFNSYRPNPHIDRYQCMGNYKRTVNEALSRRDYITALEQCIASAKSLNFHDSTVMEYFISEFTEDNGTTYKAIELPNGEIVSPKEAIAWIEQREADEHTADVVEEATEGAESAERVDQIPDDVAERIAEVDVDLTVENGFTF